MNAQSVWVGHEYAHVTYVRKKHFPTSASKVKVLSIRKHQAGFKERTDTLATVLFESGATREVNVRNLYDFWDSYMDEKEHVEAEKIAKQRESERVYREQEEARKQQARAKRTIADKLAYRLGLDVSAVETAYNGVVIGYNHLQFLLEDE